MSSDDIQKLLGRMDKSIEELIECNNQISDAFDEASAEAELVKDDLENLKIKYDAICDALAGLFYAVYGYDYAACRNDPRLTLDQADNIVRVVRKLEEGGEQ